MNRVPSATNSTSTGIPACRARARRPSNREAGSPKRLGLFFFPRPRLVGSRRGPFRAWLVAAIFGICGLSILSTACRSDRDITERHQQMLREDEKDG